MERLFGRLKVREAQLIAEQAEVTKAARELRTKRNEYLNDHLAGLNPQQIDGLQRKMETFKVEVKQIHVEDAGLVDRCESCHLGIREPVVLTAADMGGKRVFVSHPDKALLTIHDPDRFGCTPCHNGNGLAVSSVEKAHGKYEHWLWPLFAKENSEAGCLQCHISDRVLDHAPVLTRGRDVFQLRRAVSAAIGTRNSIAKRTSLRRSASRSRTWRLSRRKPGSRPTAKSSAVTRRIRTRRRRSTTPSPRGCE